MRFILSLLLILQPILSTAQTTNKAAEFNIADGVSYSKNFVINPSARKDTNNLGIAAGTATRETGAGYQFDGISSIKYDSGVINGTLTFNLSTITSPALSGNCEFYFYYKGDGTTWRAYIGNGSSEISNVVLQNATDWRFVNIFAPCGATPEVGITETTTTNKTLYFAGAYYGQAVHLGSGVPPNTFTAKVSATGVVTDETGGDWISGNCTNASPRVCTLVSPTSSTMNCLFNASSGPRPPAVLSTNTVLNINTYDLTGSPSQVDGQITCTKTGSDYIQPAITPNQWNFSSRSYTPSIANGPTCSSSSYTYARNGSRMILNGNCAVSAAGAAGVYSIDLPTGFTSTNVNIVGDVLWFDSGTNNFTGVAQFADSNTIRFIITSNASPLNGNQLANGDTVSFNITFDAAENGVPWTENQGAPQLVGSVTNKGGTATKAMTEGTFNCSGSSSITSQDDTTFTAIGNIDGVGQCAVSMSGWNATPRCYPKLRSCTAPSGASCFLSQQNVTITSGNVTPRCISDTGANCTSFQFDMLCSGPR